MKNNTLTIILALACFSLSAQVDKTAVTAVAQLSADITAQEIFEKLVHRYDPDKVWDSFEGSMHMYTIGPDWIGEEDLTIDNTKGFYRSIKYLPDGEYVKGVKNGKVFFRAAGKEMMPAQVPEKFQQGPYGLTEDGTKSMREHHIAHFSLPLSLHAAGAKPFPGVSSKTLFGTECLGIKFNSLPNAYEKGFYNVPMTLYVDPADNYRLHAVHADNGWGKDKEGVLILFSGELEIENLKIPARKLYFDAANHNYRSSDVFSADTRF